MLIALHAWFNLIYTTMPWGNFAIVILFYKESFKAYKHEEFLQEHAYNNGKAGNWIWFVLKAKSLTTTHGTVLHRFLEKKLLYQRKCTLNILIDVGISPPESTEQFIYTLIMYAGALNNTVVLTFCFCKWYFFVLICNFTVMNEHAF